MAVGLTGDLAPLCAVDGIRLGAVSAGIRKAGRRDLVLVEVAQGASCAAVFTQNAFCAAPVALAKRHLRARMPRFLLINSGNANAGTGERGVGDALSCCRSLAERAGCSPEEVLPFSTGVIGEPLPVDKIQAGIAAAYPLLGRDAWADAARGIMTTDTVPKGASRQVELAGGVVTITGIAKGAGMICPDMATMLAFVATDADLAAPLVERCLRGAVAASFNCITVDGDTSTNDACVLIATARAGPRIEREDSDAFRALSAAVTEVCAELAQAIVRDGEGATKFITIDVLEGESAEECRRVGYAVANSPLVKTAFFAGDPNWGRILAAIGRAGVAGLDIGRVAVFLDEVCIVRGGARAADYREEAGREVLGRAEIAVRILLGRGEHRARTWTCDLSYDYVRINAEYRT